MHSHSPPSSRRRRPFSRRRSTLSSLLLALLLAACSGDAGKASSVNDEHTADPNDPSQPGVNGGDPEGPVESGAAPTRLIRLSHTQYENTISDLFGIDYSVASRLPPDALNGFSFETSVDLQVDARLGPQYRSVAEEVAAMVSSDSSLLEPVAGCSADDDGCAENFIARLGARAFRRPLLAEEQERFQTLFDQGPELLQSGDSFKDGAHVVIEAMLQSPQFLYRTELGTEAVDGRIALDQWERASKISYLVYDSMPDQELFMAAQAGTLTTYDEVRTAVSRLLGDERANRKLSEFHEQAWQLSRYSRISPDPGTFPNVPGDLASRARRATAEFFGYVIENNGGLSEFLTAPYAFADSALIRLYGGSGGGAELERITLDPTVRKGLMSQVGFLAAHAYSAKTDPIHRGLFVLRYLLCRNVPDPPPGASQTEPPASDTPIETTRQEVSLLTGQPMCVACHDMINAPGFAFEGFDAAGQVREMENGVPVDTSGEMVLDDQPVSFSSHLELIDALAASQEARTCYAERWAEFAYGRELLAQEAAGALANLNEEGLGVKDILLRLTLNPEFLSRPAAEESGQ